MNNDPFTGKRVRLAAVEPVQDAKFLVAGSKDTEFIRLQSSEPVHFGEPRQEQEWLEKNAPDSWFFMIRTIDGDECIGSIDLEPTVWSAGNAWVGIGISEREFWGKGMELKPCS